MTFAPARARTFCHVRLVRFVVCTLTAVFVLAGSAQTFAAPLFTDGFESYTAGGSPLDKNTAGPNAAPNGSGNPWFGPLPPNARVVGSENGVTPHSGNNMIRGVDFNTLPADFDQNWYNLAFRLNGGQPFTGGIQLEWWFYDVNGPGDANFRDYVALAYYNTAPGDTDYPGAGSLNTGVTQIQRLSLGASLPSVSTDTTKYQARIVGATDGDGFISGTSGWYNLPVTRSVGWHHALITVDPAPAGTASEVNFYIDNMSTPVLTHSSVLTFGYNAIEINSKFGVQTGYFDDFTFDVFVPTPKGACCTGYACSIVTQAACLGQSGSYKGDGSVCSATSCCNDPRFDLDGDSDVDMNDFGAFQRCYGGAASNECVCFDKSGNSVIDDDDFAGFLLCAPAGGGYRDHVPAPVGCDD